MAKTLAGASDYASDSSMNVETERPTLVTRERERERESVGGTDHGWLGVTMERP